MEVAGKGDDGLRKHSKISNYVTRRLVLLLIKVRTQKKGRLRGGWEGRLSSCVDLLNLRYQYDIHDMRYKRNLERQVWEVGKKNES